MQQESEMLQPKTRMPSMVWFLAIGLTLGLIAVFMFGVSVATVANYALLAFIVGGHFFMHGSHAGHGEPGGHQHGNTVPNAPDSDQPPMNQHSGHTGGCH